MLVKKPFIILLSKCDLQNESARIKNFKGAPAIIPFSAVTGKNLQRVLDAFHNLVLRLNLKNTA